MGKRIKFGEKYIEHSLSKIGSKAAQAAEMIYHAEKLITLSNDLLREIQTEISDLYEMLDNIYHG